MGWHLDVLFLCLMLTLGCVVFFPVLQAFGIISWKNEKLQNALTKLFQEFSSIFEILSWSLSTQFVLEILIFVLF